MTYNASPAIKNDEEQTPLSIAQKTSPEIERAFVDKHVSKVENQFGRSGQATDNSTQTGFLRFPTLVNWLIDANKSGQIQDQPNLLLIGPGITASQTAECGGISPQLCEVKACLPNSSVEIIDYNPNLLNTLEKADSLDPVVNAEYNTLRALSQTQSINRDFWGKMDTLLSNPVLLKPQTLQAADIRSAKLGEKQFDLVLATFSLMYPAIENRNNNRMDLNHELFSNLLKSVKPGGHLVFEQASWRMLFSGDMKDMATKSREMQQLLEKEWSGAGFKQLPMAANARNEAGNMMVSYPTSNGNISSVSTDALMILTRK